MAIVNNIKLVAFDLDGTLARSKTPIEESMANALKNLLKISDVAIVTGGRLEQIIEQVVDKLPIDSRIEGLHLMPTCGGAYYKFSGALEKVYKIEIEPHVRESICRELELEAKALNLWEYNSFGDIIEDRVTQITYSALGQKAPIDLKESWDPDNKKKEILREAIAMKFPEYSVRCGGTTSLDVTVKGIDKAYAIKRLLTLNELKSDEVLYIGDRFDDKGNDYPVLNTNVLIRVVKSWDDTLRMIENFLK